MEGEVPGLREAAVPVVVIPDGVVSSVEATIIGSVESSPIESEEHTVDASEEVVILTISEEDTDVGREGVVRLNSQAESDATHVSDSQRGLGSRDGMSDEEEPQAANPDTHYASSSEAELGGASAIQRRQSDRLKELTGASKPTSSK